MIEGKLPGSLCTEGMLKSLGRPKASSVRSRLAGLHVASKAEGTHRQLGGPARLQTAPVKYAALGLRTRGRKYLRCSRGVGHGRRGGELGVGIRGESLNLQDHLPRVLPLILSTANETWMNCGSRRKRRRGCPPSPRLPSVRPLHSPARQKRPAWPKGRRSSRSARRGRARAPTSPPPPHPAPATASAGRERTWGNLGWNLQSGQEVSSGRGAQVRNSGSPPQAGDLPGAPGI